MDAIHLVLPWTVAVVLAGMLGLWLISLALRDASIVDIAWGLGFVAIAWTALARTPDPTTRAWLAAACTSLWGL